MLDYTAAGLNIVKILFSSSTDKLTPYYAFYCWNVLSFLNEETSCAICVCNFKILEFKLKP